MALTISISRIEDNFPVRGRLLKYPAVPKTPNGGCQSPVMTQGVYKSVDKMRRSRITATQIRTLATGFRITATGLLKS